MATQGRTIWDILSGKNKPDMRPQELKFFNPLQAKVGCTVDVKNEPSLQGIRSVIDKITVYETKIGKKTFYHIDYHCKGTSLDTEGFVRFRLRLIPDDDATNEIGCKVQVLFLYDEFAFSPDFLNTVETAVDDDTFNIKWDEAGQELPEDKWARYWRVEGLHDPYQSKTTILEDLDKSGKIDEGEVQIGAVTVWEFSRITQDENGVEFTEFLTVEMDKPTKFFTILRGTDAMAGDIRLF